MYLVLEKQNVFGIAVHSHHSSECRSCQTGQDIKEEELLM